MKGIAMKIKRFTGDNMREAIRSVRDAWGPDAVILSNKKLGNGVEITAAIDFEEEEVEKLASSVEQSAERSTEPESTAYQPKPAQAIRRPHTAAAWQASTPVKPLAKPLTTIGDQSLLSDLRQEISDLRGLIEGELTQMAWRDIGQRNPRKAALMRKLSHIGLSRELCAKLTEQESPLSDEEGSWKKALIQLAGMLSAGDHNLLETGGTYAIVGSTGVGKTTTVAKLAAQYAMRHGADKIGLVTTDCFRIGGVDQLSTFGQLLNIPVFLATDRLELSDILDQLSDKQLVLIDTAGMSQRDVELSKQLSTLLGAGHNIKFYLTLSATAQQAITNEIMRVFSDIKLSGTVVTKVDEAASLGGVLSALIKYQLPTLFISNGQKVPEDLHPGSAIELVKIARDLMQRSSWQDPELDPVTNHPTIHPTTHNESTQRHG